MRKIIAPRAGGKTIELIKMSAETGAVIVCNHNILVNHYKEYALRMKLQIPEPITFEYLSDGRARGKDVSVLIDNADDFISRICERDGGVRVKAISMDLQDAEISDKIYGNHYAENIRSLGLEYKINGTTYVIGADKPTINTTNTTSTMRGLIVGDRVVVTGSPRGKDDYNIGKVAQVMLIEPFNDDQDMIAVREFNDVKGEWYGYEEIHLSPFPPVEQIPSDNSDEKSSKEKAFAEDIAASNRKSLDLGRRGPDATGTYTMGGFPQSATANKEVEAEDKPDQEKTATTETPAHNFKVGDRVKFMDRLGRIVGSSGTVSTLDVGHERYVGVHWDDVGREVVSIARLAKIVENNFHYTEFEAGDVVVVLDPTGYSHIDRGDTGRVVSVYESHANVAMHKNNAVIGFRLSSILALNKSQKQKQNTVYDFKIGDRAVTLVPYSCGNFNVPSSIAVDITFVGANDIYAKAIDSRYKEYDLLYKPTELIISGSTEAKS